MDSETTSGEAADGIGGGCSGGCGGCTCARMREALRAIGWSAHTGAKRFGPKAQIARWGLGVDDWPDDQPSPHPLLAG